MALDCRSGILWGRLSTRVGSYCLTAVWLLCNLPSTLTHWWAWFGTFIYTMSKSCLRCVLFCSQFSSPVTSGLGTALFLAFVALNSWEVCLSHEWGGTFVSFVSFSHRTSYTEVLQQILWPCWHEAREEVCPSILDGKITGGRFRDVLQERQGNCAYSE